MAKLFQTRELYHGLGSLSELKNITGKKAIIVTGGKSVKENGTLAKVEAILDSINIEHTVFSGVEPDPSINTVRKGAAAFEAFSPDWIIGLGGCSAIDAAKAMWAIYEHPTLTFDQMIKVCGIPPLRNKARFVAIPSTSGTGTEITALAVITDTDKGVKYPLVSHELLPDLAIVDGELCKSMPKNVTANTGLDALTHSVEAYVSNIEDNYADAMAKGGIELVFANLERAYNTPDDLEARQNMHDASCLGGFAFTNVWLGIVHSIAHQVGGVFGVPHGCANAIALPSSIRFNSTVTDRYEPLARLVGKNTAEEFATEVESLRSKVNVASSFKEYGISQSDWDAKVKEMAVHAMADPCTSFNPRVITVEEMERVMNACYTGEKVNF